MSPETVALLAAELLGAGGLFMLGLVLALVSGRDTIDPPPGPARMQLGYGSEWDYTWPRHRGPVPYGGLIGQPS